MAKQLKRIEKRYVPQQESYRNLPGLRPTAEPVAAAATPVESDEGSKLRQWGEALASGNKALKDFFSMEKSFEETNRVANKANAFLGLPPVDGPGLLNYGVEYGSEEGRGMARSAEIKSKMMAFLEEKNYLIDPTKPSVKDATARVHSAMAEFLSNELTPAEKNSRGFIEGAAQTLAQARVEALVKTSKEATKQAQAFDINNYSDFVMSKFTEVYADVGKDPKAMREFYSRLTKEAPRFNLERDAASDVLVTSIAGTFANAYVTSMESDDLDGMSAALRGYRNLFAAAQITDSSGQPLGGTSKDANGNVQIPLSKTLSTLRKEFRSLVKEHDSISKSISVAEGDEFMAATWVDIHTNAQTYESAKDLMINSKYYKRNAKAFVGTMKLLGTLENADAHVRTPPGLLDDLMVDSSLTQGTIDNLVSKDILSKRDATYLMKQVSSRQASYSRGLQNQRTLGSIRSADVKQQKLQDKTETKTRASEVLRKVGVTDPKVRSAFNSYVSNISGPTSDLELEIALEDIAEPFLRVAEKKKEKAVVAAETKATASVAKSTLAGLFVEKTTITGSQYKKFNTIYGGDLNHPALAKDIDTYNQKVLMRKSAVKDDATAEDKAILLRTNAYFDLLEFPLASEEDTEAGSAMLEQLTRSD